MAKMLLFYSKSLSAFFFALHVRKCNDTLFFWEISRLGIEMDRGGGWPYQVRTVYLKTKSNVTIT